jgi:hypothetical protein
MVVTSAHAMVLTMMLPLASAEGPPLLILKFLLGNFFPEANPFSSVKHWGSNANYFFY